MERLTKGQLPIINIARLLNPCLVFSNIGDFMVEIEFNGTKRQVSEGTTIMDLLRDAKIETRFCAVESNLDIVPKSEYATHQVHAGDKIEVVTLVGGG